MNSSMPSTGLRLACSLRITSAALMLRMFKGFRLMEIRPLFRVVLVPSAPMNEERL